MRKRRRKTRPEPPSRLDERLTALDLAALDKELQLLLETRAPIPEMPDGVGLKTPEARADELVHERPFRPQSVPEAEVVIIRRDRAAPARQAVPAAAEPLRAPAPAAAAPNSQPASGAEGAPRAAFNGVVEEASVVIIRRPPRERIP